MKRTIYFIFICYLSTNSIFSQSGTLDPSFDLNGISAPDSNNVGMGMALQPDGKIVLVGSQTYPTPTSVYDFVIKRLMPDGSLDTSFSSDGFDTFDFNTSILNDKNVPYSVVIQPDGKILIAGYAGHPVNYDFAVVRYHSNGTLDNSFGTNGIITYDVGGISANDIAFDMTLDANQNILLAGYTTISNSNYDLALCRLNPDGSLDSTFGSGGIVIDHITGVKDVIKSVIELQDNRIAVCGSINGNSMVAIYLNNGQLDTSFSGDGIEITAFHNVNPDQANCIVQQGDGKLLICGTVDTNGTGDFLVARYLLDGSLDLTFSSDGYDCKDMGGTSDVANDLIIQPDNYIMIGGYAFFTNYRNAALTRYDFNGNVDVFFGTSGIVITANENFTTIEDIAIQSDLKLLAGGSSGDVGPGAYTVSMAAARYDIGLYIGLEENTDINNAIVYPNPFIDHFILEVNLKQAAHFNIDLINSNGDLITSLYKNKFIEAGVQHLKFNTLPFIPSGVYYLMFYNNNSQSVIKLVR